MGGKDAPEHATGPTSALARNRRMATGVLIAMAAVFAVTHLVADPPAWLRLVRSMAEAGMIGGLADWFAVTALFRHPLGLPIPHTALLPKNQARAAVNVGRFFETHFLEPAQLEARVRALSPSRLLADWLSHPGHARLLAVELTRLLGTLLATTRRRAPWHAAGAGSGPRLRSLARTRRSPAASRTW